MPKVVAAVTGNFPGSPRGGLHVVTDNGAVWLLWDGDGEDPQWDQIAPPLPEVPPGHIQFGHAEI